VNLRKLAQLAAELSFALLFASLICWMSIGLKLSLSRPLQPVPEKGFIIGLYGRGVGTIYVTSFEELLNFYSFWGLPGFMVTAIILGYLAKLLGGKPTDYDWRRVGVLSTVAVGLFFGAWWLGTR
jgi:hypothetical protein